MSLKSPTSITDQPRSVTPMALPDAEARRQAVDITRSFIVQAPAGSGKTALLVQRFMNLLAHAEKAPEECLCITFTKKAAAEMRERVLATLEVGMQPCPESGPDFMIANWHLAQSVLKRDRDLGWDLLDNPGRLQIQTIDALCARIARQMPLMSGFGVLPDIREDPSPLYEKAAMYVLADVETDEPWSLGIRHLLAYMHNDVESVKRLLVDMLPKRDQWLSFVGVRELEPEAIRTHLEQALVWVIEHALSALREALPTFFTEVLPLAKQAAEVLRQQGILSPIRDCHSLSDRLPGIGIDVLPQWLGLAELLLTQEGAWRKQVTVKQGCLPPSKAKNRAEKQACAEHKAAMMDFLGRCQSLPAADPCLAAFQLLKQLPNPHYEDQAWVLISALMQVLPVLAGYLTLVFQEVGEVDFTEVTLAAHRALGDPLAPSEVLLSLDTRLKHILLDEFQDTSRTQVKLLAQLVAGWTPGDGRTLFLVGDPMQSIYRFRQADVSLFLRAMQTGIGDVPLTPLRLSTNFRSDQAVVDWNNQLYHPSFPAVADVVLGAVPFARSQSCRQATTKAGVWGCAQAEENPLAEAQQVCEWIKEARDWDPKGSVAILVRTRAHLNTMLPTLRENQIAYIGLELEPLIQQPMIRDLMTVTRAMNHLGDRVAWLALLRLPFCRLSLCDLQAIATWVQDDPVWFGIGQFEQIPDLSEAGRATVARLQSCLEKAWQTQHQMGFRDWIEAVWGALGGYGYQAGDPHAHQDARQFFALLESSEREAWLLYPDVFEAKVARIYRLPWKAISEEANPPVHILTLHKAKGLEFDTVILPGLGKTPRRDKRALLLWAERHTLKGPVCLFSVLPKKNEDDKLYRFLQGTHEQALNWEALRLLYVATTRAKKRLYWIGHLVDEKPLPKSLLSLVWAGLSRTVA